MRGEASPGIVGVGIGRGDASKSMIGVASKAWRGLERLSGVGSKARRRLGRHLGGGGVKSGDASPRPYRPGQIRFFCLKKNVRKDCICIFAGVQNAKNDRS